MPELPEVHTTVSGLQRVLPHLRICDVWTDYHSHLPTHTQTIKNPAFFKTFKKSCIGKKILSVERRGKNILIHIESGNTILIHMKMTGCLLYGTHKDKWIHLTFSLSNKKHLALSDLRKFAKVTLVSTNNINKTPHLDHLGPDPTDPRTTFNVFKERLYTKHKGKIKTVLMDQTVLAGIGNIYSDEILWYSSVHPESTVGHIPPQRLRAIYKATKMILAKGIDFGGDSVSDYRNIHGEKGSFQHTHNVYRLTNQICRRRECNGVITKKSIGGRSAHFCTTHQKQY